MAAAQAASKVSIERLNPERPRNPQSQRRVNSRDPIIRHDSQAAGERFGLPRGERLPNIEDPKKYKAQQQIFPVGHPRTDSEIRNQLSRYFIDHNDLRIFLTDVTCGAIGDDDAYS